MTGDGEDGEEAGDTNYDDDHEVQEDSQPAIGHVEQEEGDVVPVQHLTEPDHVRGVPLGYNAIPTQHLTEPDHVRGVRLGYNAIPTQHLTEPDHVRGVRLGSNAIPTQHLTEPDHVRGVTLGAELRNVAAKKWMSFRPNISQNLFREELHKK